MTTELVIWSPAGGWYLSCPPDDITWLDRRLLSAGRDLHLHRKTRCAGIRYVARQWEIFNRDTDHEVYLASRDPGAPPSAGTARTMAQRVLPAATTRLEPRPVPLELGEWLLSVGEWPLVLFVGVPPRDDKLPRQADDDDQPAGEGDAEGEQNRPTESIARKDGEPPVADAVARVRAYFDTRGPVQMAIAYYYQEFIRGKATAQVIPMTEVAVALNLTNQTVISDYKRELQKLIWNQPSGHQRELAEFLIDHELIDYSALNRARQLALANEKTGKAREARKRLGYRPQRP